MPIPVPEPATAICRASRSPARSSRQVPLLRGDILAVSSQPLQIAQRDLGGGKKKPGHYAHGNGHGHVWVYARLRHIKRAMHGPD